ncbi:MAG: nucleotide-binding protein [Candidatus Bathyarchaeota archaeon]|nr:nucleotide-binding protein [Candidatus Bathyarchaeum sp.]
MPHKRVNRDILAAKECNYILASIRIRSDLRMGVDFGSLIIDLETLVSSSKEDFSNEFWCEYENYLKTYNKLLKDLQSLGFYKSMKLLEPVPFSEQSYDSKVSKQEKAKLREIANTSENLLKKVKSLLVPQVNYSVNNKVRSNQIFVVQGNNKEMNTDVLETLEKLELETIVLNEELNNEKKLVEKVNGCPNISFGVVLLFPDDSVCFQEKTSDETKYRVSQNVIFELGFLLGKLGKQNIVAVYLPKKGFEIPNQYEGIRWVEYKGGWYFKLINELKEANYDVDANKLSWI